MLILGYGNSGGVVVEAGTVVIGYEQPANGDGPQVAFAVNDHHCVAGFINGSAQADATTES